MGPMSTGISTAHVGIAGVNTRQLHTATLRIAGAQNGADQQCGSTALGASIVGGARLGDRAAAGCWTHAAYLLDYSYLVCPDRSTGRLRWRAGFAGLYAPSARCLPVFLDSAAYRTAAGTVPPWASYTRYCQALELIRLRSLRLTHRRGNLLHVAGAHGGESARPAGGLRRPVDLPASSRGAHRRRRPGRAVGVTPPLGNRAAGAVWTAADRLRLARLDIGLVACSMRKADRPLPARDLYVSPLFRAARAYAERRYGPEGWLILSACHGLVHPNQVLAPYDLSLRQLTRAERAAWGDRVAIELTDRFPPGTAALVPRWRALPCGDRAGGHPPGARPAGRPAHRPAACLVSPLYGLTRQPGAPCMTGLSLFKGPLPCSRIGMRGTEFPVSNH